MALPDDDLTPMGQRLRERTASLGGGGVGPAGGELNVTDAQYGFAHAYLSEALVHGLRDTAAIIDPADDTHEPWSVLFDVDTCPVMDMADDPAIALRWLGQCVGVTIAPNTDPVLARQMVRDMLGMRRGSVRAITTAIRLAMGNPAAPVFFRERNANMGSDPAYQLEVVTDAGTTADPNAVRAACMTQKPAGIILDYHTVASWDYQQVKTENPGPYSALTAQTTKYPNYGVLQLHGGGP